MDLVEFISLPSVCLASGPEQNPAFSRDLALCTAPRPSKAGSLLLAEDLGEFTIKVLIDFLT